MPQARIDRSKLLIGTWLYDCPPSFFDETHVREAAECGIDFVFGLKHRDRAVLDNFAKYGVGVFADAVPCYWWGGDGSKAGKMQEAYPREKIERRLAAYSSGEDHPAIVGFQLCDEPSAKDMAYIGEISAQVSARVPQVLPYVNLYPNYASYSTNTSSEAKNQLGTGTYREYIDEYCRTSLLDYISYDFYVYTQNHASRPWLVRKMYDNFNIVADACRRTGRSFWYAPQVNSHMPKNGNPMEPTTVGRLRFQAYTAMAYGVEVINWACWKGWWTNNVYTADGVKTMQYDALKKVNAELRRFSPDYMRFRNTATHFVGFSPELRLDLIKQPILPSLDTGRFCGVRTLENTALLVGEMAPRVTDDGRRALFVVASGDMYDVAPAVRTVTFRLMEGDRVRVLGVDGEIVPTRAADGSYAYALAENAAALMIVESSNK